jgi:hypothetical protein
VSDGTTSGWTIDTLREHMQRQHDDLIGFAATALATYLALKGH